MNKKVLITVVAVVALVAAGMFYLRSRNYSVSPPGKAELTSQNLNVVITYCRPSVRGRVIFGEASQGALQPFGQYWRLGANDATEISFSQDVQFNGQPVKKGTYRMYAFPGASEFEIALNTELGEWGVFEPDYSKDVLRTKVSTARTDSNVEQFTIDLENAPDGMNIVFEWADTRFVVPVKAN